MSDLTQAIKELQKRPITNQAPLSYLAEHEYKLDRLTAATEVVLSLDKTTGITASALMDLEER